MIKTDNYKKYNVPCIVEHFASFKNAERYPDGVKEILDFFYKDVDLYEMFIQAFAIANDAKIDRTVRTQYIQSCILLYKTCDNIQAEFEYHPEEMTYKKRFVSRHGVIKKFDDGINYDAPNKAGLYFIGETHFNPYTREEFYWVKIGLSTNLNKRMKQYNTCCPMLWRIGFLETNAANLEDIEHEYHEQIKKVGLATCNHNEEWFLVDRETYLAMCEKGFSYFD